MDRISNPLIRATRLSCKFILVALPAFAGRQVVTTAQDSVTGSLRSAITLSAAGDTVAFNVTGKDTLSLGSEIDISKDLVVSGINQATSNRVVVRHYSSGGFSILGGNVAITDIVMTGGYTYGISGGHVHVGGLSTRVLLNNSLFQNGRGEGSYYGYGGALGVDSGSLTVFNCTISKNSSYASYGGSGGGISNVLGDLAIVGSTITGNRATEGGGVYIYRGTASIDNCTISNDSCGYGGAVCNEGGQIIINASRISLNRANVAGGGVYNDLGNISIRATTLSNDTSSAGGAVFNTGGYVTVTSCVIVNNAALVNAKNINNPGNYLAWYTAAAAGGGVFNGNGSMTINATTVSNNASYCYATTGSSIVAINSLSYGGGICNAEGNLTIQNSTIDSNSVTSYAYTLSWSTRNETAIGGGIYDSGGTVMIANSTIMGNKFSGVSFAGGGGIFSTSGGSMTVMNCTVAANLDNSGVCIASGSCFMLNSIILNAGPFSSNPAPFIRSVNVMANVPLPGIMVNCDTAATAKNVFCTDTVTCGNHGGPTQTISLGSPMSTAIGKGIRAGTYTTIDTASGRHDTVFHGAYFNGTSWLALESDSAVAASTPFSEITTDQRGITRKSTPCAGAFEFTAQDNRVRYFRTGSERLPLKVSLSRDNRILFLNVKSSATIDLFNCSGQKIFSESVSGASGTTAVSLPMHAKGLVIFRMTSGEETVVRHLN